MKRKAFTLIELLVVIAIIALLLSILLPALSKVKAQARRVICATRLKSIHLASVLYANDDAKGRLPQGGIHNATTDYDDGIGIQTHDYFKLANYVTAIGNLPTTYEAVSSMPNAELAAVARQCVDDGGGQVFVCPSVASGDKTEYSDAVFRKTKRMSSVIFSNMTYVRIGYCYLAGFETDKWNFDELGGISSRGASPWKSPGKTTDNGSLVLATDRNRYVPADTTWVNHDFISISHSGRGFKQITPVGIDFDLTKEAGTTNILTLDGSITNGRLRNSSLRQMFQSAGTLSHEDYTFF